MAEKRGIIERLSAVRAEAKPLVLSDTNPHGRYKYAGVDQVYDMLRPLVAKHELDLKIDMVSIETERVPNAKGGESAWLKVEAKLWFECPGETEDAVTRHLFLPLTGPQSFESAISYLAKQFLRQRLQLATGEQDADATAAQDAVPETPPRGLPRWKIEIDAFGQVDCDPPMPGPEAPEYTVWAREAAKAAVRAVEASDRPDMLVETAQVAELIAALPEAGQKWVRSKVPAQQPEEAA